MYAKISSMLDRIASSLESKGLIKEAFELDKVADAFDKLAWDMDEEEITVKLKSGKEIKADSLKLRNQLTGDIEEAIQASLGILLEEGSPYKDRLIKALEEAKIDFRIHSWYKFPYLEFKRWIPGGSYDMSSLYQVLSEAAENQSKKDYYHLKVDPWRRPKSDPASWNLIKLRESVRELDLIAETYDSVSTIG